MALKVQDYSVTGKSTSGINYTFILRVTENSIDEAANTSNLTVQAILKSGYSKTSFLYQTVNIVVKLDDQTIIERDAWRTCEGTEEHIFETWTGDIAHDGDGTLQLPVYAMLEPWSSFNAMPPKMEISDSMELTQIVQNVPPEIPSELTAAYTADGEILIQWQEPEDPDGNLVGYELERSDDDGASFEALYSGSNAAFCDEPALEAGRRILYRVRALDSKGAFSGWSDTVSITVNSPPSLLEAPAVYSDRAGTALAEQCLEDQALWLFPGRWKDPDNNLIGGSLKVEIQTKDLDDAEGAWEPVQEAPVSAQLLQIAPQVADDISHIRYRVSCVDAAGAGSDWAVTDWVKRNVPFSFCDGQWMKPRLDGLAVMPYVRIAGAWFRHGGLIPDPESSLLGYGKLGEMILGG